MSSQLTPAAAHVEQANAIAAGDTNAWGDDKRMQIRFGESDEVRWLIDADTGLPRRSSPRTSHAETERCARCHSQRAQLHAWGPAAESLGDSHQLALLEPGLYHADGQILDEVFVHGSFLQSRMYAAGGALCKCAQRAG